MAVLKKLMGISFVCVWISGCVTVDAPRKGLSEKISVNLESRSGSSTKGQVQLQAEGQRLLVTYSIRGLKPGGLHGFHIHETGNCDSVDAMSAGGHHNPLGQGHGSTLGPHRHAGDMGNISADTNGNAQGQIVVESASVSGPLSVRGKAIIVHGQADDFLTQPAGNAGPRWACGVIPSK